MTDSDSDIENNFDSDLEQAWAAGCSAVIPEKSRERYENTYRAFKQWCETKKISGMNEKIMLAYFVQRSEKLKAPGSLWAEYSMLRSTIFLHDAIKISQFTTLIAFLKRKNVGYRPKKASVFTREDMNRFLVEASDQTFLTHKVGSIRNTYFQNVC